MTPRAAIYARFSTDMQSERSVDDQVALCRAYAERSSYEIVATYEDRAASGASIHGRPGLQYMMAQAREQRFEIVIAESMSRIGRDQGDRADIRKRLAFAGVKLATPSDGIVSSLTDGIRAVIDSQYIEDLKVSVHRGMAGVVREGRHAGGRAYGCRPIPGQAGQLAIEEAEAATVRRIFDEYVAGRTPRDIACRLNQDGVAPPRGRVWNASTINGSAERGNGIIRNELYAGRLVWNKVRMVKDPDTGKRVSRPNPASEHQAVERPDLAIVSAETFRAAAARKEARAGVRAEHQHQPRHLLSGLLRCGCCGAGMSTNGEDKSGRIRVRCSAAAESGTCPDPKTFYLETIERAVLSGLKAELRAPAVLAEYVREYHAERRKLAGRAVADRSRMERRLAEVKRELDRYTRMLLDEVGDEAANSLAHKALAREMREIEAKLESAPEPENLTVLHPAALKRYEAQLERLEQALAAGVRAGDLEGTQAIRDLVDTVTVTRSGDRIGGVQTEIAGRLNALLGDKAYPNKIRGVWGAVVAEEGLATNTRRKYLKT